MILINQPVNWSLVSGKLDSSKQSKVSMIASSPERDQCQNLCSLLDCFVSWNNATLISPLGASALISLTGKKWRLHFLPQPAAGLSWPQVCICACVQTCSSLISPPASSLEWQLKLCEGGFPGQGGRRRAHHHFLGCKQLSEGQMLGLVERMSKPCFSPCNPLVSWVWTLALEWCTSLFFMVYTNCVSTLLILQENSRTLPAGITLQTADLVPNPYSRQICCHMSWHWFPVTVVLWPVAPCSLWQGQQVPYCYFVPRNGVQEQEEGLDSWKS